MLIVCLVVRYFSVGVIYRRCSVRVCAGINSSRDDDACSPEYMYILAWNMMHNWFRKMDEFVNKDVNL